MATFYYEAHNKWSEPIVGEIEAMSEEEAAGNLRAAGLFAREISREKIRKPRYEPGISVGEAQTRVYKPEADDVAIQDTVVIEKRGVPDQTMRMTKLSDVAAQAPREDDGFIEAAQAKESPPGVKPRPLKRTYDDEKARQKAIEVQNQQVVAWEAALAKELEGISAVLGLVGKWRKICKETPAGESLPPGVPRVGGKTWETYEAHMRSIGANLFKEALGRAAQRMPIERVVNPKS